MALAAELVIVGHPLKVLNSITPRCGVFHFLGRMSEMSEWCSKVLVSVVFLLTLGACTDSGGDVEPSPILGDGGGDSSAGGDDGGNTANGEAYSLSAMLTAYVDEIVMPNYAAVVSLAGDMADPEGPLSAYCDAIDTAQEAATLDTVRQTWRELAASVQKTELHAIGPAAANAFNLQYRLNSYMYGTLSTCGVDGIAAQVDDDFSINNRSINQRGIGALEYLLFNDNLNHSCPPQASATKDWNDLSESVRKSKRCDAARLVSTDVSTAVETIVNKWDPSGDNFRADFLDNDKLSESLQMTTDGMFYLEEGAKDAKLGNPLGIIVACSALTCPEQIEAPFSASSLQQIIDNLKAFEHIFVSNEQTGFDDHIISEGFPEVSQRFIDNLSDTIAFADTMAPTLTEQVSLLESEGDSECTNAFANPDQPSSRFPACTLYGMVKRIVDDLKIDFVTIVNVSIPGGSQADND